MIVHEIVGELRKRPIAVTAGSVISSLIILAGCGDSGNNIISACPDGFSHGQNPVANKKGAWREAIDNGVGELRAMIPADSWTRTYGQKRIDLIGDSRLRDVAKDIFNTVDGDSLFLDVDSSHGTQLDDVSEIFCRENGEVYLSAEAQAGIVDLRSVGIDVDIVPDYLQPKEIQEYLQK